MLPLHEATSPSLGQGCRTTQQAEPEICSPFLRCPCWKLLACCARAFCTPSIVGIGLSFQLSRGAQPWSLLLGGSGSCMEEHRGKRLQFSTSYGPTKKGRVFLLSLHLLHACHDSPCHLSTLLQGRFLPLTSQHIFLKPPNNPLQLHQPGPIQPGNAPHNTCCWRRCNLSPLAGPCVQYLPGNSPWWRILAIKLTGVNGTARPRQGKAELLLDLNANYYNLNAFSSQDIALLLTVFYRKQFEVKLTTKILAIAEKKVYREAGYI